MSTYSYSYLRLYKVPLKLYFRMINLKSVPENGNHRKCVCTEFAALCTDK